MPEDTTLTADSGAAPGRRRRGRTTALGGRGAGVGPHPPHPRGRSSASCSGAASSGSRILAFLVAFSGLLHLQAADGIDYTAGPNATLSMHHWLGTDAAGATSSAGSINGARVSVVIGLCATAIALVIGGILGMLVCLRARSPSTRACRSVMFIGLAFPAIVAVLAILEFWGRGECHIILVLGLLRRAAASSARPRRRRSRARRRSTSPPRSPRVRRRSGCCPRHLPERRAVAARLHGVHLRRSHRVEGALALPRPQRRPACGQLGEHDLGGVQRLEQPAPHPRARARPVPHARRPVLRRASASALRFDTGETKL